MKTIIVILILLCMTSCSTFKYSARKYEQDKKYKGCPTYGFDRVDNRYNYFNTKRIYQQTTIYKYGPYTKTGK
jgi:hypothetical protein